MKESGARTIAQDEDSCVVFGMPKEAIRLGAADEIVSLPDIPKVIINALQDKKIKGV
jgi:two-component system chemotaxis response regulator CheB